MSDRKLVRDLIPDAVRAEGRTPVVEVLTLAQRRPALVAKLLEEAAEAAAASDGDLPEELADVLEVVRTLAADLGMSLAEVVDLADGKRERRGGFDRGLVLVRAAQQDEPPG